MPSSPHLTVVVDGQRTPRTSRACRTRNCSLLASTPIGFCGFCEAVYDAARELRRRRLEWCWARIEDIWRPLIGELSIERRERLQAHLAAHAAEPGGLTLRAIEDFLGELRDLADEGPDGR